jgi:hypothetical protein
VGETGIERFVLIPKGEDGLEERGLDLCSVPLASFGICLCFVDGAYDDRSGES